LISEPVPRVKAASWVTGPLASIERLPPAALPSLVVIAPRIIVGAVSDSAAPLVDIVEPRVTMPVPPMTVMMLRATPVEGH
jgi:hypothetical protein